MVHRMVPRKFRVGSYVETQSGLVAKVIGSAVYGLGTKYQWVEYRLLGLGSKRTFYRKEQVLSKV